MKFARKRLAQRALQRQRDYQRRRADLTLQDLEGKIADLKRKSAEVRGLLEAVRPIGRDARVLEVGSGSEGLIFFFGVDTGIGVDPLADEYARVLPWHGRARTISCGGEALPFDDGHFDIVLCDNVIDHAEDPWKIVAEMERVLAPDGLLYFTVNFHHMFWHLAAKLHAGWRAIGIRFELSPFADHTVHFTKAEAERLLRRHSFEIVSESTSLKETREREKRRPPRHLGDRAKRVFFKNARYTAIAIKREPESQSSR